MMPPPMFRTIDPDEQAIFDAMFAFMNAQGVPTCNSWANQTGSGLSYGLSATGFDGSQVSHTYFQPGSKVVITPTNASLGPGETQQMAAMATDADGNDIAGATFTWTMQAGSPGTVDATGLYTAPASIPFASSAVVTATLTDKSAWSSMNIALHP